MVYFPLDNSLTGRKDTGMERYRNLDPKPTIQDQYAGWIVGGFIVANLLIVVAVGLGIMWWAS